MYARDRVTITISLLSRGPCIYRSIQRKYGAYDHKVADCSGSGEIPRTICTGFLYHTRWVQLRHSIPFVSPKSSELNQERKGTIKVTSHYRVLFSLVPVSVSSLCRGMLARWLPLFYFHSLSVQHAASWNSRRRSSARHRITGHSRFRALEPKHTPWGPVTPQCNQESMQPAVYLPCGTGM